MPHLTDGLLPDGRRQVLASLNRRGVENPLPENAQPLFSKITIENQQTAGEVISSVFGTNFDPFVF